VFFCQYFARGVCSNGPDCSMFHLVPSAEDCAKHEKSPTTDVFGRQRHAEERGNRGGVGSFFSQSRTLYVGYGAASDGLGNKLQEVMEKVFSEWGPTEDVYIVRSKSIAFVRYVFRASAEFAKEAMGNQSLQPAWWPQKAGAAPEILNIRWAFDDPNPTAIRRVKREYEDAFVDGADRAEARLAPEQRAALAMQRTLEAGVAQAGPAGVAALPYPDTDLQFGALPADPAYAAWAQQAMAAGYRPDEVAAYYASYCASRAVAASAHPGLPQQQPQAAGDGSTVVLAADAYEYDADDPAYYDDDNEGAPPMAAAPPPSQPAAPAAAAAPPAAPAAPAAARAAAAPLAALASYGSDEEDA
jgi:hypothetical protein